MKCIRWLLALAVSLVAVAPSSSQVLLGPGYGGASFRVAGGRRHVSFSVSIGSVCAPPVYCPPIGRIVVYTPPPLVMVPSSNPLVDAILHESLARQMDPLADVVPPGPGRLPPARQPLPPAPPEQPPPQPPPAPPPPQKKEAPQQEPEKPAPEPKPPRELPSPPLPEDDPHAENARLLGLGQAAFADAEYGRAAERFRQAALIAPAEPLAHFLLAQALLALGKYHDAVLTIHAGLAYQPDWPAFRFRPLELYGANVADYSDHLRHLEEALRRQPDDPTLLFLQAYQLWWDGRRDEAREVFSRARRAGANAADIDRFLHFLPAGRVL